MSTALPVAWTVIAAALGWALTGRVLVYARSNALIDVPNDRSSHSVPTPRGGGMAVVGVTMLASVVLVAAGLLEWRVAAAFVLGGGGVAWIGWRDDHAHVPPLLRAGVHTVAASIAVYLLGGAPALTIGDTRAVLGLAGGALAVVAIVWCVNMYNFMDGIDGLSGIEAVTVAAAGGVLLLARGETGLGLVSLSIAGASAGFLAWNWSPARIFMGDVGSGFLGFAFGALAVAGERRGALPALAVALLLGLFLVDATVTLLRRMRAGERWYAPHRSHAYQRAVRAGSTHRQVSIAALGINLVLALLTWWGVQRPHRFPAALGAGVFVLLVLYLFVERISPMFGRRSTTP